MTIELFRQVAAIREGLAEDEELRGDDLDTYLESLYLIGVAITSWAIISVCSQFCAKSPTVWKLSVGKPGLLLHRYGPLPQKAGYHPLLADGWYLCRPRGPTAQCVEAGHRLFRKG